ncbi:uncharacterized protein LOC143291040 [Babylonia areolata]|uniref:uncharacterized protein LOC143291040 n=1 Tax=Babylonia areolata TaxID=304850 RepID=UPI003FD0DF6D
MQRQTQKQKKQKWEQKQKKRIQKQQMQKQVQKKQMQKQVQKKQMQKQVQKKQVQKKQVQKKQMQKKQVQKKQMQKQVQKKQVQKKQMQKQVQKKQMQKKQVQKKQMQKQVQKKQVQKKQKQVQKQVQKKQTEEEEEEAADEEAEAVAEEGTEGGEGWEGDGAADEEAETEAELEAEAAEAEAEEAEAEEAEVEEAEAGEAETEAEAAEAETGEAEEAEAEEAEADVPPSHGNDYIPLSEYIFIEVDGEEEQQEQPAEEEDEEEDEEEEKEEDEAEEEEESLSYPDVPVSEAVAPGPHGGGDGTVQLTLPETSLEDPQDIAAVTDDKEEILDMTVARGLVLRGTVCSRDRQNEITLKDVTVLPSASQPRITGLVLVMTVRADYLMHVQPVACQETPGAEAAAEVTTCHAETGGEGCCAAAAADQEAESKQCRQLVLHEPRHEVERNFRGIHQLQQSSVKVTLSGGLAVRGWLKSVQTINEMELSHVIVLPPGGQPPVADVIVSMTLNGNMAFSLESTEGSVDAATKQLKNYFEDMPGLHTDCVLGSDGAAGWDVEDMLQTIPTDSGSPQDILSHYTSPRPEFRTAAEREAAERRAELLAREIEQCEDRCYQDEAFEEEGEEEGEGAPAWL